MADAILAQSGIYAITNNVNGKRYIGSSVDITRRFTDHLKRLRINKHHSAALQRAWHKHGEHAFSLSVLERVSEPHTLIEREQAWIDAEGKIGSSYNMSPTAGSPLGVKHSAEARSNMSIAASKRPSDPVKVAKMRQANIGLKRSPETIEKMRAAKLGVKRPRAAIEKMVASRSGWRPSPDHIEAIRQSCLGRKKSPEEIAKTKATKAAKKYAASIV